MNFFPTAPNTEVPKAGKSFWMTSMNDLMDLARQIQSGEWGRYIQAQGEAANQATYRQTQNVLPLRMASRGVDSGIDFGKIDLMNKNANLAAQIPQIQFQQLMPLLQAISSNALSGISNGTYGGSEGWGTSFLSGLGSLAGGLGKLGVKL